MNIKEVKKDSVKMTVSIDRTAFDLLTEYCMESGMPKTTAVERILAAYIPSRLKKLKEQKAEDR